MKRRDTIAALLAGLCPRGDAATVKTNNMESAVQIIRKQIDAGVLQSAVMHVRRGDETFVRAFGKAETTDAMFLLGSITKPFTAVAAIHLAIAKPDDRRAPHFWRLAGNFFEYFECP